MTTLNIRVNSSDLDRALATLQARSGNLNPALRDIGEYMKLKTRGRFDGEESPDGLPWEELKPSTRRQKQRKGLDNGILKATKSMRDTIAYQVLGGDRLEIGSSRAVPGYSLGAIHQFGAPRRNIPARPFLGVNAQDEERLIRILRQHLQR